MASSERDDLVDKRFGEAVSRVRSGAGLSQRQLAERLASSGMKVDAPAISRIEAGTRSVRLPEAFKIAEALETDVIGLLADADISPRSIYESSRQEVSLALDATVSSIENLISAIRGVEFTLRDYPELIDGPGMPSSPIDYVERVLKNARRIVAQWADLSINERFDAAPTVIYEDETEMARIVELVQVLASGMFVHQSAVTSDPDLHSGIGETISHLVLEPIDHPDESHSPAQTRDEIIEL